MNKITQKLIEKTYTNPLTSKCFKNLVILQWMKLECLKTFNGYCEEEEEEEIWTINGESNLINH